MIAKKSAGFTLVEILVAFTIAATSLVLLFRIHTNATGTTILAEEYQIATQLAQSLLAEWSTAESRLQLDGAGVLHEKYRWRVRGTAYVDSPKQPIEADESQRSPYALRTVAVEVSWSSRDRDRAVALRTLKPLFEKAKDETPVSP